MQSRIGIIRGMAADAVILYRADSFIREDSVPRVPAGSSSNRRNLTALPPALRRVSRHGRQRDSGDRRSCASSRDPAEALGTGLFVPRRTGNHHCVRTAALVFPRDRGHFSMGDGAVGQVSLLPANASSVGRFADLGSSPSMTASCETPSMPCLLIARKHWAARNCTLLAARHWQAWANTGKG